MICLANAESESSHELPPNLTHLKWNHPLSVILAPFRHPRPCSSSSRKRGPNCGRKCKKRVIARIAAESNPPRMDHPAWDRFGSHIMLLLYFRSAPPERSTKAQGLGFLDRCHIALVLFLFNYCRVVLLIKWQVIYFLASPMRHIAFYGRVCF